MIQIPPQHLELHIKIPLYAVTELFLHHKNQITYSQIYSQVLTLITTKHIPKNHPFILYHLRPDNKELQIHKNHTFTNNIHIIVYFQHQHQVIGQKLNNIYKELITIQNKFVDQTPNIDYYGSQSGLSKKSIISIQKQGPDGLVDISVFYSSPLVKVEEGKEIYTKFQEVNYMDDIQRIKKVVYGNQQSMEITIQQMTKHRLISAMQNKIRILHLYCNIEVENGEVFLALQHQNSSIQQNLKASQLISNVEIPDLVILVGHQTSKLANFLNKKQYPKVIYVETVNYNEDHRAKIFVQKIYLQLSKGEDIRTCFTLEKQLNNQKNDYFEDCCCLHNHDQKCLWIKKVKQFGIQTCHRLYHVQHKSFNCNHDGNPNSCILGKKLFAKNNINYPQFRDKQAITTCNTFCCCTDLKENKQSLHQNHRKFNYFINQNQTCDLKVFKTVQNVKSTKFSQIKEQAFSFQNVYGVNKYMNQLMKKITSKKILSLYGPRKSGKTIILKQCIRYLFDRNLLQHTQIYFNWKNLIKDYKSSDLQKALNPKNGCKVIIIFYNFEDQDQSFRDGLNYVVNHLFKIYHASSKVITISQKPIEYGDRFEMFFPLDHSSAVSLYLRLVNKIQSSQLDIQNILQGFSSRNPMTYQQISQTIRSLTNQSVDYFFESIKECQEKLETEIQSELLKMNSQKQPNQCKSRESDIYKFLLFLYQFQEGLTQLDFKIILKTPRLNEKTSYWNLIINLEEIVNQIFSEKNSNLDLNLKKFIEVVQIKGHYYKSIKLNKICKQVISKQKLSDLQEMKVRSYIYLCTYTSVMVKYLALDFYYHQSIYQFSNLSDFGIFQIIRTVQYKKFYLGGDKLTNVLKEDNEEDLLNYIHNNVCTKQVDGIRTQIRSIKKLILQSKENIITVFKKNPQQFQTLDDKKEKNLEYFLYNLLLNYTTICVQIGNQMNTLSYIQTSITFTEYFKKFPSYIIIVVKLSVFKLGAQLRTSRDDESRIKLFSQFQNKMKELIDSASGMQKFALAWQIQIQFIKLYIYLHIIQSPHYQGVIEESFENITKIIRNKEQNSIKLSPLNLNNNQSKLNMFKLKYTIKYDKLEFFQFDQTQENQMINLVVYNKKITSKFHKNVPIKLKLYLQLKLNIFQYKLKKSSYKDFQDLKQLSKKFKDEVLDIIQKKEYRITNRNILLQSQFISNKLKEELWKNTNNLMVYMKSTVLENFNIDDKNITRYSSHFKQKLLKMFKKSKKNVMTIFRKLTFQNLQNTLVHGCFLLVLTVDFEQDNNQLYMHFQDNKRLTSNKILVKSFVDLFTTNKIGMILVCGRQSSKFIKYLNKSNINGCFPLLAIDTQSAQQYIAGQHPTPLLKYLSRIVLQKFLEFQIQKFSEKIVTTKIKKSQMNNEITRIANSTFSSAYDYIQKIFQNIFLFQDIMKDLSLRNGPTLEKKDIEFMYGQCKDISFVQKPYHNLELEDEYENAGKLNFVIEVFNFLTRQLNQDNNFFQQFNSESQFLNIYGVIGVGKTTLIKEIAIHLLSKNAFKDGIYLIDCREVLQNYQGNVMQHLQNKLNLFANANIEVQNKNSKIELLIILDHFNCLNDEQNKEFFKLMQQIGAMIVIITEQKITKRMPMKFPLVNCLLDELSKNEAFTFLYSQIDFQDCISKFSFDTIEDKIRDFYFQSTVPQKMKERIQEYFKNDQDTIRKKGKDVYNYSSTFFQSKLKTSIVGKRSTDSKTKNWGIQSKNINIPSNRIRKIRIVSKKSFDDQNLSDLDLEYQIMSSESQKS